MVFLDNWLSDDELLKTAKAIAQPVTSFVVARNGEYEVRWFSLVSEINLCGHGSLGAGAALINTLGVDEVWLRSDFGNLKISRHGLFYQISLPAWQAMPYRLPDVIRQMGILPVDMFTTRDLVVVFESASDVANFTPDFDLLKGIGNYHAFIITAQSSENEYVLRYFAPKIGIPEDLATGSAHSSLAPYWFDKLCTEKLYARQLSNGGGYFQIENGSDNSVLVSAHVREKSAELSL